MLGPAEGGRASQKRPVQPSQFEKTSQKGMSLQTSLQIVTLRVYVKFIDKDLGDRSAKKTLALEGIDFKK